MKPEYPYLKHSWQFSHLSLADIFFDVLLSLHDGQMSIKDGFMMIFLGSSVAFCSISGPLNRGWNFEVLLGNKRRFTWGWAEVLSMDHSVQIQYWTRLAWPELFSLQLLCVFLVIANEWEIDFFWPNVFNNLCCDTQTRIILHKGARPKVSLRLNTVAQNDKKFRLRVTVWETIFVSATIFKNYIRPAILSL